MNNSTPASREHERELDHQLRVWIDEQGLYQTACSCGESLGVTRIAPHHCLGLWRRHVVNQHSLAEGKRADQIRRHLK